MCSSDLLPVPAVLVSAINVDLIVTTASDLLCARQKSNGTSKMPEEIKPTRWLTKAALAQHYCISLRTVTNLMRRRVLPYVKIGHVVRFDSEACEQAMKKYEVVSVG